MFSNIIRIYTSLQETGDFFLILNFSYNFTLNLANFSQIIYYNYLYNKKKEDKSKEKNE